MVERRRWQRYDRSVPGNVWYAIEDLQEAVDDMVTADEVAEKVSASLHKERFMMIGWSGKIVGGCIALGSLATALHSWLG